MRGPTSWLASGEGLTSDRGCVVQLPSEKQGKCDDVWFLSRVRDPPAKNHQTDEAAHEQQRRGGLGDHLGPAVCGYHAGVKSEA
jgi:hypothetical protein